MKLDLLFILKVLHLSVTCLTCVTCQDIYVSNGTHILRIQGEHGNKRAETVISQGVSRVVGLAVDAHSGLLFWSDIDPEYRGIYTATVHGEDVHQIVQDIRVCNGLTVDWINKHVYWTDEHAQTVEMCDFRGQHRRVVVHVGLSWPRGIVIDPLDRVVFWGDQGTRRVERVNLDGTNRQTIIQDGLVWPNQLAFSYAHRRLFWVDAFNKTVDSSDVWGNNRRCEVDLHETVFAAPIFGLGVTGDAVYFDTYYDGAVLYVRLHRGEDAERPGEEEEQPGEEEEEPEEAREEPDVPVIEIKDLTTRELFSIAINDPDLQPIVSSPCEDGAHDCSHVCLATSDATYRCSCPTYGNLVLQSDNKTCAAAEEMLIIADKDGGHVILYPLGSTSEEYNILASSTMPVAVTYDPVERQIYWSDVAETTIYRMRLDASSPEVFLNASHGIGVVDGLAMDHVNRRLYFTNMGTHVLPHVVPRPEGHPDFRESSFEPGDSTFWSRIEFISLDREDRYTVTSNVDKPRGLTLDLDHGFLFYSDWDADRRVVQCDLSGDNCSTIRDMTLTSNPNGLSYHGNRLYMVDSNFNHHVDHAHASAYNVRENTWTELTQNLEIPFGVTANENTLYYTNWVTTSTDTGSVTSYHTVTKETRDIIQHLSNPSGIVYVNATRFAQSEPSACLRLNCSHICVGIVTPKCICPDELGYVLSEDGTTCVEPEQFILYPELNTIKMASLGSHDPHLYTFQYGGSMTSFLDVTYNNVTKTVYWIDETGLYRKVLGTKTVEPVVQWEVDTSTSNSLVLITRWYSASQTLYIARSVNDKVSLVGIDVTNNTVGAMETVFEEEGYQYADLTADKKHPYLYFIGHASGSLEKGWISICRFYYLRDCDLVTRYEGCDTVSIATSTTDLYVTCGEDITARSKDGSHHRQVEVDGFDGEDITVSGGQLYYTSPGSLSVRAVDLATGDVTVLVQNVTRPGRIYVHRTERQEEIVQEPTELMDTQVMVSPLSNGTGEQPADGTHVVPRPRFYNCPQGELLTLDLPPGSNQVKLDLDLRAEDFFGETLAVSGNAPIPPDAWFTWEPGTRDEPRKIQHVKYVATDKYGQHAVCEFSVLVVDKEPPRFSSCPRDIEVNTSGAYKRVWWVDPYTIDNVGIWEASRSRVEGDRFRVGTWPVVYKAKDFAGNIVWCNFTVTVRKKFQPCDPSILRRPLHGRLICTELENSHTCVTSCDPQHVLNHVTEYHSIQCGKHGRWSKPFPQDYSAKACLKFTPIRRVERKLKLWFLGPCDPFSQSLKKEIAHSLVLTLKHNGLCEDRGGHDMWSYLTTLCDPEVLEVNCGQRSLGRLKRSAASLVNIEVTLQENASILDNLTSVEERMNETTQKMVTWYDTGTSFIVRGSTYRSLTEDDVTIEPIQLRCPLGAVWYIETCVLCPVGTRSDPLTESCVDCLPGAYQDEEGQLTCKVCPHNHMTPAGAYNVTQCKQMSLPSKAAQIRDIVIAMVTGTLLIVVVMVAVCCCLRKKTRRKALCQSLSAAGCVKQNNPYIIDVTTGKEHLYEEIPAEDKAAMETKQSVARDNDALENSQSSASCENFENAVRDKCSPQEGAGAQKNSKKHSNKSNSSASQSKSRKSNGHDSDKRINAKMKQYDLHTGTRDQPSSKEEICLEVQSFLPDKGHDPIVNK